MSYTQNYLDSFGKLTPSEIKIIKKTWGYEKAQLADAIHQLINEVKKELIKIIFRKGK